MKMKLTATPDSTMMLSNKMPLFMAFVIALLVSFVIYLPFLTSSF